MSEEERKNEFVWKKRPPISEMQDTVAHIITTHPKLCEENQQQLEEKSRNILKKEESQVKNFLTKFTI